MVAGLDTRRLTPPQRRVVDDLLGVHHARPAADDALVAAVRDTVVAGTAPVAARRPAGAAGVRLTKAALDALRCDGRYLDLRHGAFAWSRATVLGTLVHRGVELDQAARRQTDVPAVVEQAWAELTTRDGGRPDSPGAFLAGLTTVEAVALKAEAVGRVLEFRECWPLLPGSWAIRHEVRLVVRLHRGALALTGRPDLILGRGDPARRRLLLVDFKTGERSERHRLHLRFYALLAALKYGSAPFRVATYYLDEAAWEAEDIDGEVLHAAAAAVVDAVGHAARLEWRPPPAAALRLHAGPACGWCSRADGCPALRLVDTRLAG